MGSKDLKLKKEKISRLGHLLTLNKIKTKYHVRVLALTRILPMIERVNVFSSPSSSEKIAETDARFATALKI